MRSSLRPGCALPGWLESSRRRSWRSPRCSSCCRRCSTLLVGCQVRSVRRLRWRLACGRGRRRIGSWWAWRRSACCRAQPRISRRCVLSTMRSGWTEPPRKHWGLWRADCWPSRSHCYSPLPKRLATSWRGCPSWPSEGWVSAMRRRCWRRSLVGPWMSGSATGWSRRRMGTRWRCSSCCVVRR